MECIFFRLTDCIFFVLLSVKVLNEVTSTTTEGRFVIYGRYEADTVNYVRPPIM